MENQMTTTMIAARKPQEDTLHAALRGAADGTDWERAYYGGWALGWLAAFVQDDMLTDLVSDAEKSWVAAPFDYQQASARFAMLNRAAGPHAEALRHSGVLAGYFEGTAERPDAEQCISCERRLLTDDIYDARQCPFHGWIHDDCAAAVCRPGLVPQGCYER